MRFFSTLSILFTSAVPQKALLASPVGLLASQPRTIELDARINPAEQLVDSFRLRGSEQLLVKLEYRFEL